MAKGVSSDKSKKGCERTKILAVLTCKIVVKSRKLDVANVAGHIACVSSKAARLKSYGPRTRRKRISEANRRKKCQGGADD